MKDRKEIFERGCYGRNMRVFFWKEHILCHIVLPPDEGKFSSVFEAALCYY